MLAQKIRGLTIRATLENLTDSDFLWTQTLLVDRTQRLYKSGRAYTVTFSYSLF